jgi:hypothetical protein
MVCIPWPELIGQRLFVKSGTPPASSLRLFRAPSFDSREAFGVNVGAPWLPSRGVTARAKQLSPSQIAGIWLRLFLPQRRPRRCVTGRHHRGAPEPIPERSTSFDAPSQELGRGLRSTLWELLLGSHVGQRLNGVSTYELSSGEVRWTLHAELPGSLLNGGFHPPPLISETAYRG